MIPSSIILMMHRIGERDASRIPANQNMLIEPNELERFVNRSKSHGWSFLSIDEIYEAAIRGRPIKKALSLTFDDGYLDNYTLGYPLLKQMGVPFCIYITTGFIESNRTPWWYMLEELINLSDDYITLLDGTVLSTKSLQSKNNAFLLIRSFLMSVDNVSRPYMTWVEDCYKSLSVSKSRLFMNWNEVSTLSNDGLVTLGAHTHKHLVLSRLSSSQSFEEISISKEILEYKLQKKINHFAFPFGGVDDISQRDIEFVKDLKFLTAATTTHDAIWDIATQNPHCLPRVFFGPDFNLSRKILGLFKNKLKTSLKKMWKALPN